MPVRGGPVAFRLYVGLMEWVNTYKDLLGVVIATLAVGLSLSTVLVQRSQQRRDAYRYMHEQLISPEIQQGRRLLFDAGRSQQLPDDHSENFYLMNRAVGMYDTLGLYVRRKVVPRRWVLEVWHHSIRDSRAGAELLAAHRRTVHHSWSPWPHLWYLLGQAERYRSRLPCCVHVRGSLPSAQETPATLVLPRPEQPSEQPSLRTATDSARPQQQVGGDQDHHDHQAATDS